MKINAHNRLRECPPGPQVLDIPQFRYVQDAQRHLDSIRASVQELSGQIKATQRRANSEVMASNAPVFRKLDAQYELLSDLYASWRSIESTDAQFNMQFDARSGNAYTGVQASLHDLRQTVGQNMTQIFAYLENAAQLHCPLKFKNQVQVLTEGLALIPGAHVHKNMMYASASTSGDPVFTAYAFLVGSSESDHVYVSAQWSPSAPRMTYLQTNHEFATPDELSHIGPGVAVRSNTELVKAALSLLTDEGMAAPVTASVYEPDQGAHSSLSQALSYF